MSKPARKRIPARKPARPPKEKSISPQKREKIKRLLVFVVIGILAAIPFSMGKYFEFSSPDAFDGGSYAYSAKHILSGARIGYEEKPSAQAGTLLVNMFGVAMTGFNETGAEILQTLLQAAALILMFVTVRRLYGTMAAVVSVSVASIYLSAPLIAKYGNVKEQFMIAFMIMGICLFVFYRLSGRWGWALLTGAVLIWGPMFKQTGVSAIGAVGLFTLVQPVLRRESWARAGKTVLLLVAGAAITLTPICAWYASMGTPLYYWPYSFAFAPVFKLAGADLEKAAGTPQAKEPEPPASVPEVKKGDDSLVLRLLPGYVSDSWRMLGPEERKEAFRRVLRYYGLLILPIALALGAILVRIAVLLRGRRVRPNVPLEQDTGRFVPLLALWWFFDMAFVWISPHSYEQYYLPLTASGAVLGGYLIGLYSHKLRMGLDKTRWVVFGLVGALAMIVMPWHIFFGISKSPHSGAVYRDPRTQLPAPTRGYLQKWQEIAQNPEYDWIRVAQYIREHSEPNDAIYVWGWVPGIYVQAQRMSPTPKAFEGMMHTLPPAQLAERVREIVAAFEKSPPKFIVDTKKRHFPWNRPPLELWPGIANGLGLLANPPEDREQLWLLLLRTFSVQPDDLGKEGFLRPDRPDAVERYDAAFEKALRGRIEPAEALRYNAVRPLRQYVMKNYEIVGEFGAHALFRRR